MEELAPALGPKLLLALRALELATPPEFLSPALLELELRQASLSLLQQQWFAAVAGPVQAEHRK